MEMGEGVGSVRPKSEALQVLRRGGGGVEEVVLTSLSCLLGPGTVALSQALA